MNGSVVSVIPRPLVRSIAVLIGLAGLLLAPEPAAAQGWGFLGNLFGGGRPQQQVQPPPADPYSRYYRAPRHRTVTHPRAAEPRPSEAAKPPSDASRFVVVLGDSLGQLLANGLDDALRDRPDVAVLHKAHDSTGLVREDYYNWPKVVEELLDASDKAKAQDAAEKAQEQGKAEKGQAEAGKEDRTKEDRTKAPSRDRIDVAVIMLGSNDRQSLTEDGKTYASDTDEWTAAYTRRAMAVAEAFKKHHVPLVWVGVPITKSDSFADDMAALNDIYRDVAAKTGATFVDTWEAFSDDNGDFSAFGPDINGQTVRLRSADGIHFTRAGARKLAHFVELPVRKALDQEAPAELPSALAVPEAGKPSPAKPDVGPVKLLSEPPVAANGQLGSVSSLKEAERRDASVETALIKGEPPPARPGRADDPTWPPPK